jgi:hypothetical protein
VDPWAGLGLLDASGKTRYVTYLSGRQVFAGGNIGLGLEQLWMASFDSEGQIRTAGNTRAFGFPTTAQAYQPAFELCEAVSFSAGLCLPKAPLSYFTVLDGAGGKLRASTLYGGVAATLKGAMADPGGSIWMTGEREPFLDDRQPFLVLMKPDASGIEGSWPAPVGSYFLGSPIPGGFASVMLGGRIRLYRWQDQGPRIYALSGQIAPGETVDVYTAGYSGNQASLYFDGILAAADPVPGEPGHWKATVPDGITRDAIVDIALIADERLAITKVSSN